VPDELTANVLFAVAESYPSFGKAQRWGCRSHIEFCFIVNLLILLISMIGCPILLILLILLQYFYNTFTNTFNTFIFPTHRLLLAIHGQNEPKPNILFGFAKIKL